MFEKEAEAKGKEFDWKFNLGVDLSDAGAESQKKKSEKQLTKAKEIMNLVIEGIKNWGIVGGTERGRSGA